MHFDSYYISVCSEVLRTDLAFFLDASASLGIDNFNKTKQFVKTISNAFDVSPSNTHVSVVTYTSDVKIEFDFEAHTNKKDLYQALDNISYRSGRLTYIDSALITADKEVFTTANKARSNAFRVGLQFQRYLCEIFALISVRNCIYGSTVVFNSH